MRKKILELVDEVNRAWAEFSAVLAATHASSTAYYTFLSLVPLLTLCISLISFAGIDEQDIYALIDTVVPDVLLGLAHALVSDAFKQSGLAFSLSTLSLLWSASKGAKALRVGLNAAYAERETRGAIAVTIISIIAVLSMGLMIAAAMYLVFGNSLMQVLSRYFPRLHPQQFVMEFANLIATLASGVVVFALCYTHLPAGNRSFKAQLPGASCALIGCGVLSFGFRIYVDQICNYTVLYGSIATVALLLFWMYLVFYILVACGFLNRYLQRRKERQTQSLRRAPVRQ